MCPSGPRSRHCGWIRFPQRSEKDHQWQRVLGMDPGIDAAGREPGEADGRRIDMTQTPQYPSENRSTDALFGPADFIAALPGVLGYYPQESAVVVCLQQDDLDGPAYLGPVLRADLCHASRIGETIDATPVDGVVSFLAIVVSRVPNSQLVRDATEKLYALASPDGRPLIHACWHVSEIASGTPYCLVFGPAPAELLEAGLGKDWLTGTVASVVSQPTMAPLLAQGALPELGREDAHAFFEIISPAFGRSDAETLTRRAHAQSRRLRDMLVSDRRAALGELKRACEALATAPEVGFLAPDTKLGVRETFPSAHDAEIIAAVLADRGLRDCLVATALAHPHRAGAGLLALARGCRGVVRANALSLWAIAAVKLKLASWASVALICAQEEVPGHSLSEVLLELLRVGEHTSLLRSAELGCQAMWEELEGESRHQC